MKKMLLWLTCILLLFGIKSSAQIIYVDINPDTTINTWNNFTVKFSETPLRSVIIWFHPWSPNQVVVQTMMSDCEILWDETGTYPAKLDPDDVIDSTGTWHHGDYDTLNVGGAGNWKSDATDKYLGFRFGGPGQWHYGWIRLDIDATPTMFTIKDRAHQSQPGESINAGQTPPTGILETTGNEPGIFAGNKIIYFRHLDQSMQYEARVYTLTGQLLVNASVNTQSNIDLSAYPEGIYVVQMVSSGFSKNYKLIVR